MTSIAEIFVSHYPVLFETHADSDAVHRLAAQVAQKILELTRGARLSRFGFVQSVPLPLEAEQAGQWGEQLKKFRDMVYEYYLDSYEMLTSHDIGSLQILMRGCGIPGFLTGLEKSEFDGDVYLYCLTENLAECSHVMKVVPIPEGLSPTSIMGEYWLAKKCTEDAVAQKMAPIFAPVYQVAACEKAQAIFAEMDGAYLTSAYEVGKSQAENTIRLRILGISGVNATENVLVFTIGQLRDMFFLVLAAYRRHRILHGEVGLHNIWATSFNDDNNNAQFVLGVYGISGRTYVSGRNPCAREPSSNPALRWAEIVLRLELELRALNVVFVAETKQLFDTTDIFGIKELEVPANLRLMFIEQCGEKIKKIESQALIARQSIFRAVIPKTIEANSCVQNLMNMSICAEADEWMADAAYYEFQNRYGNEFLYHILAGSGSRYRGIIYIEVDVNRRFGRLNHALKITGSLFDKTPNIKLETYNLTIEERLVGDTHANVIYVLHETETVVIFEPHGYRKTDFQNVVIATVAELLKRSELKDYTIMPSWAVCPKDGPQHFAGDSRCYYWGLVFTYLFVKCGLEPLAVIREMKQRLTAPTEDVMRHLLQKFVCFAWNTILVQTPIVDVMNTIVKRGELSKYMSAEARKWTEPTRIPYLTPDWNKLDVMVKNGLSHQVKDILQKWRIFDTWLGDELDKRRLTQSQMRMLGLRRSARGEGETAFLVEVRVQMRNLVPWLTAKQLHIVTISCAASECD